jgi:hypothetical protein
MGYDDVKTNKMGRKIACVKKYKDINVKISKGLEKSSKMA